MASPVGLDKIKKRIGPMYMRTTLILSIFFCWIGLSRTTECCAGESQKTQGNIQVEVEKSFDICIGQSALLKSEEMNIEFNGVIRDDRCPVEEECVWEGDAEVRIIISKTNKKPATLILHTSHKFATETIYLGYKVTLVQLNPQKSETFPPNHYRATLTVTNLNVRKIQGNQ